MKRIVRVSFILSLAVACSALAANETEDKDLGPGSWPETKEQAVAMALHDLKPEDREQLKAMKKEDLFKLHMGYGMWLRNHFGLWRGNRNLINSVCGHPCHPDDASMLIIEAMWVEARK